MNKYMLTRDVTISECPWLKRDFKKGETVFVFSGCTYDCISKGGKAFTWEEKGGGIFFELPINSVKELKEEEKFKPITKKELNEAYYDFCKEVKKTRKAFEKLKVGKDGFVKIPVGKKVFADVFKGAMYVEKKNWFGRVVEWFKGSKRKRKRKG